MHVPSKTAIFKIIASLVILVVMGFFMLFPAQLDKQTNLVHDSTLPLISEQAKTLHGHCPSSRNISDDLMEQIASKGGLIALGYWDGAVCEPNVNEIAKAIKYGVKLVGSQHIALGSDYDGAVSVPFDTSELIYLTQALLDLDLTEQQIRQVMGGNMLRYLQVHLPD
jgi:microsomal dipeptidase-like Zn-dependent dipeptidase